jgi:hypothetical protein
MIRRHSIAALLALILGVTTGLLLAGCDKDEATCRPEVPAGRIEGHVRCGGLPTSAQIVATRIPEGPQLKSVFQTKPDAEGFYALDLPEGRYTLVISVQGWQQTEYDYAAAGLNYGQSSPDTLVISPESSPLVLDFTLGRLVVDVGLSSNLDGESGEVRLHARTLEPSGEWRTYVDRGSAEIKDGHVSMEIPGIIPDQYRVELVLGYRQYDCSCPYDGEHVWYPGVRDSTEASWISVGTDSTVALSVDLPTEPARIEGEITGAWQDLGLLEPPALALFSPDSLTIMGSRGVGYGGSFGVDIYLPGPVKLCVTQAGVEQWIGGPTFEEATTFQLEAGETISGVELVQCGLRLSIDAPVRDLESVDVRFYDPVGLTLLATFSSDYESDMVLGVPNLRPGDYLMHVSPRRPGTVAWRPQWYDRATSPEGAQPITLTAAREVLALPLLLEPGGVVRGTVLMDPDARRDYYIIVTPAGDRTPWGYSYAWDSGPAFAVLGLPDGDFKIGAYPIGANPSWEWPGPAPAATRWYPGGVAWDDAGVITIVDGGDIEGVELAGD